MPVKLTKTDGKYKVSTPHGTKSKGSSLKNALAQKRLLQGVEHGWKPSGKKKSNISELAVRKYAMAKRAKKT